MNLAELGGSPPKHTEKRVRCKREGCITYINGYRAIKNEYCSIHALDLTDDEWERIRRKDTYGNAKGSKLRKELGIT